MLNLAAVFSAPDDELLLITKTILDLIMPAESEALIIAFKFEPLPEAKTHNFKANVNGILLILSKNSNKCLNNQLIYCKISTKSLYL